SPPPFSFLTSPFSLHTQSGGSRVARTPAPAFRFLRHAHAPRPPLRGRRAPRRGPAAGDPRQRRRRGGRRRPPPARRAVPPRRRGRPRHRPPRGPLRRLALPPRLRPPDGGLHRGRPLRRR